MQNKVVVKGIDSYEYFPYINYLKAHIYLVQTTLNSGKKTSLCAAHTLQS